MKGKKIEYANGMDLMTATVLDKVLVCSGNRFAEHKYLVQDTTDMIRLINPESIKQVH